MAKLPLFRILVAQSLVTVFVAIVCMMIGKVAVISALLAGVSSVLPSLFVFLVSMKPIRPSQTGLEKALQGEVGKIALTIVLLAGIFVLAKPLSILVFFGVFVMMQVCQVIVPLVDANRLMKRALN